MAGSDVPCAGTHCSHHHHDGHHHGHGHSDHRHGEEKAVESLRKLKVKDRPPSTLPSPTPSVDDNDSRLVLVVYKYMMDAC